MIRQGYNHPSIMMWGIENEVYQPASAAAFGKRFSDRRKYISILQFISCKAGSKKKIQRDI